MIRFLALLQMALLLCTAMQPVLGLTPVQSQGAGHVAQVMQADLVGRTVLLAPLGTLYNSQCVPIQGRRGSEGKAFLEYTCLHTQR